MTIRSILELLAEADANLPDNNTQLISPADVRNLIKDFLDTMSPAYGSMNVASKVQASTTTPAAITGWSSVGAETLGYYAVNLVNGTVARSIATAAIAGATDFIIIDGSIEGPINATVTLSLYKNGAPTGYDISVTTTGANEPIGFNFAALSYTATVDALYDVRISNTPGDNGNYTIVNMTVLCQAQPVRSFV